MCRLSMTIVSPPLSGGLSPRPLRAASTAGDDAGARTDRRPRFAGGDDMRPLGADERAEADGSCAPMPQRAIDDRLSAIA